MSRFVMVSFLFMGWSFYELSGGRDFVPPIKPDPIAVAKIEPAAKPQVTAASLVTTPVRRPVLQTRTNREARALPDRPAADPNLRSEIALAQIAAVGDGFKIDLGTNGLQPTTPGLQLASLDGGLMPLASDEVEPTAFIPLEPPAETTEDLRIVTATRVNMRDGPGTVYPVVTQLNRNASVAVIDDNGTGWLKLRVVDSEQVGWIAASLISK